MAREPRRRACPSRSFAKITAEPINCHSPATSPTAVGTITNQAAWSKRPWSAGGCRGTDARLCGALSQNATARRLFLRFGTRTERITSESVAGLRTHLFTARCRWPREVTHHIQNEHDRAQPAADDEG